MEIVKKPVIYKYSLVWFDEFQGEYGEEVRSSGLVTGMNIQDVIANLVDMYGPDFYDLHLDYAGEFEYCIEREEINDAIKWMDAHNENKENAACDQSNNQSDEQESGDRRVVHQESLSF